MHINKIKKIAAGLSILSNVILTLLKIIAGLMSGSLSIISEAIHSLSDFAASILTFFSVMKSSRPADADHPYGHGKYEDMSGFIEGILIILASLFIIYEAIKKIVMGTAGETENTIGIIVMFIAVVMNIIVSSLLFSVAKKANSISLYADGEHLRTDVFSSLGVLVGLILIKITGHTVLDPIIALLVAAFIYRTGYTISKRAIMRLLDYSLPDEEIEKIKEIVNKFHDSVQLKENGIKARQIGPSTDIDLILQFPKDASICACHNICDEIEKQIQTIYFNCSISIHSEPICYKNNCQDDCENKFCKTN